MSYVLENTLRRPVLVNADGETKSIPSRGTLVVKSVPDQLPAGVLYNAESTKTLEPTPEVQDEPEPARAVSERPSRKQKTEKQALPVDQDTTSPQKAQE